MGAKSVAKRMLRISIGLEACSVPIVGRANQLQPSTIALPLGNTQELPRREQLSLPSATFLPRGSIFCHNAAPFLPRPVGPGIEANESDSCRMHSAATILA